MNSGSIFGSSTSQGNGSFGSANGAPSVPGLPGSSAAGGLNGAAASGGPIVGVTVPLKKASILVYRKKKAYDKWQFVYNPQEEITSSIGQGNGQAPGAGIGTPAGMSSPGQGGANGSPFGSSNSGFGSSNGGLGSSNGGMGSSGGGFGSSPSTSNGSSGATDSNSNQTQSNPF
jgi:hypothetical protein